MTSHKLGDKIQCCDLLISHASEDKESVARPLAAALTARGLKVCYDDDGLRIGDSIPNEVNERISASRFAVTVLSRAYIDNRWTEFELDTLVYLAMSTGRRIFPVWHDMVSDDLDRHALFFSTVVGMDTRNHCIEKIAEEIFRAVSLDTS